MSNFRDEERCHFTYVTEFVPTQEEVADINKQSGSFSPIVCFCANITWFSFTKIVYMNPYKVCDDTFEKACSIAFKPQVGESLT